MSRRQGGMKLAVTPVIMRARPQLGRLIVSPFATIGVLSAVLVWEIEHVGSIVLSLTIALGGVVIGITVARRLRHDMERLADHYEALLRTADEESQRAEAANRLKDEFLANLSHELRTPLNSILGWARLLSSGRLVPKQASHAIAAIERAGWAQSALVEDLLDISRIVAGKLEVSLRPTRIQPLVSTVIDALRPAAEGKRLTLTVTISPTLQPMNVDPDRIRQVVRNLLSNAIKFTPPGGAIEVRVDANAGDLRLIVCDSGIGFSGDIASHMFERFRQGDSSSTREYSGLGLGLGIVRHVLELHGGTIAATSAGANAGSTFEARIPIRLAADTAIQPARGLVGAPMLNGISVLIVDDDPHALEFARSTLQQSGATVATATSTKEAREGFARAHPDVIISDLVMSEEDGFRLIRDIRALERRPGRRTPSAALTALARADDRRKVLAAGFQMHIAKPIDPSELVITVERLAHQRGQPSSEKTAHRTRYRRPMSLFPDPHRRTILVVDDDADVREVIRAALTDDGYTVESAATARDGIDYLRSHTGTSAIVLDLLLPDLDGIEFRRIQLRDRSLGWIPVVVTSAAIDGDRLAREARADAFVRKPLDLDALRRGVDAVTSGNRVRARSPAELAARELPPLSSG